MRFNCAIIHSEIERTIFLIATYHTPAIDCDGCANSIKRSLGKLAGIEETTVDIVTKNVMVNYSETAINDAAIRARLEAAGFPAEK